MALLFCGRTPCPRFFLQTEPPNQKVRGLLVARDSYRTDTNKRATPLIIRFSPSCTCMILVPLPGHGFTGLWRGKPWLNIFPHSDSWSAPAKSKSQDGDFDKVAFGKCPLSLVNLISSS